MLAEGPTLEAMARRLTLSPRSLQRRLAEHGTLSLLSSG
jgi:AraC-like DNA-binding protein